MSEKSVFKKIIDGEIPCHKVYEDEHFLAFLDIHPQAPGHTLVIPKEEARWVWDVERYQEYWEIARILTNALRKAFGTEWVISKIVGDEVPHAHIHLFPVIDKDGSETEFEVIANKIKSHL
ncbi:HIT domain-containing protein [Patescibacteria group bacterium]|nr:HIT domain-containing protein [Patescibacteria group bacterium]